MKLHITFSSYVTAFAIAVAGAVTVNLLLPSSEAQAATPCVSKTFSTKKNNKNTCNTYIHAILIGDGIVLDKYSTSKYFTASTKNAVKRFQTQYYSTAKTTSGTVDANTWKALCTVAARKNLEQFSKSGCKKYISSTNAKKLFVQANPNAYSTGTFTIASWNTLYNNSPANVAAGASELAQSAQLIAFQELNFPDRRQAIRAALIDCAGCRYSGFFPDAAGSGWGTSATVSLIWDKQRFTALKTGTYSVLGDKAYGANTANKWINWVKLRDDITGKQLYLLNTHFVAGVEKNGLATSTASHQKNYQAHMKYLVDVVKKLNKEKVPVYVTGDFNVDYRLDSSVSYFPNKALTTAGMKNGWKQLNLQGVDSEAGTMIVPPTSTGLKNRIIDYVWSNNRSELTPLSMTINHSEYSSDHYPVLYSVRTTVPGNKSL